MTFTLIILIIRCEFGKCIDDCLFVRKQTGLLDWKKPDQEYASISFTLVSIRSWNVADSVAPIVHDPRKMKINMSNA